MFAVLFDPILPVFAILALGFAMGRGGVTSIADARAINRFALTIPLPLLVFGLLADAPIRGFDFVPVAVYAASQAVVFAAGFLAARRLFGREPGEALLLAFSGIFTNNAFFGVPISLLLYGEERMLPITTIVTLDSAVTFAGTIIALQIVGQGRPDLAAVGRNLVRSPLLISIALGMAVSLSGLGLPGPVRTFVDFNGAAAAPVALFAMGVVLSETRFGADPAVVSFAVVKLAVFPALVALGLAATVAPGAERDMFVLAAAGPAGSMAFNLALMHGIRTDALAQVVVWTSLLSLIGLALLA
ncbi:MAG: AEC family transporter [Pseudomonadota bacterium]